MTAEPLRQDLLRLYEEWFTALGQEDPSFFERTLSDDWHYTDVRGTNRGKQEYLTYIAPLRSDVPVNRVVDLVVRPFGDVWSSSTGTTRWGRSSRPRRVRRRGSPRCGSTRTGTGRPWRTTPPCSAPRPDRPARPRTAALAGGRRIRTSPMSVATSSRAPRE